MIKGDNVLLKIIQKLQVAAFLIRLLCIHDSMARFLHPVFGPIRCLVSITRVEAGAELLTHYGYLLSHCPAWYAELWDNIAAPR